ncbi:hypothetical protein [Hyphomonas sp.]|uniref:hypothetical protein n=1 Tax=Hyphomonas sp. TaxID=87 RepID=UPI003D26C952
MSPQPLQNLFERPVSIQIKVYNKVFAELSLERQRQRDGSPRSAELIPPLLGYLDAVSSHWEKMRETSKENPDFFEWPSTVAWIGSGIFKTIDLDEEGALRLFGYSVSADADLSEGDRRNILDVVFAVSIPPFGSWDKLSEWGEPESSQRLMKMANCLASFARNGSRRRVHYMDAPVKKWCDDLEYLRKEYYEGRFGFGWPSPLDPTR